MTLLAEIARLVEEDRLSEPFRSEDVRVALLEAGFTFAPTTPASLLARYRAYNPHGKPVWFQRLAPGLYRLQRDHTNGRPGIVAATGSSIPSKLKTPIFEGTREAGFTITFPGINSIPITQLVPVLRGIDDFCKAADAVFFNNEYGLHARMQGASRGSVDLHLIIQAATLVATIAVSFTPELLCDWFSRKRSGRRAQRRYKRVEPTVTSRQLDTADRDVRFQRSARDIASPILNGNDEGGRHHKRRMVIKGFRASITLSADEVRMMFDDD